MAPLQLIRQADYVTDPLEKGGLSQSPPPFGTYFLGRLVPFLFIIKIIGHFIQKHGAPADSTGKSTRRVNPHVGHQKEGKNHAQGSLDKRAQKGHIHVSHPAEKSLDAIGEGRKQIEKGHGHQILASDFHHAIRSFPGDEQHHDGPVEKQSQGTDQNPVGKFQAKSPDETRLDARFFFRAPVLGHKGGDSMGNTLFRRKGKIVHSGHSIVSGDGIHPEGVDRPLDHQLSHGLTGLLQSRHRTILQRFLQKSAVHAPLGSSQTQIRNFF